MRGGGLAPSDLPGWNCHKKALSVLAEDTETKWVAILGIFCVAPQSQKNYITTWKTTVHVESSI